jgi:hypothetical protein
MNKIQSLIFQIKIQLGLTPLWVAIVNSIGTFKSPAFLQIL